MGVLMISRRRAVIKGIAVASYSGTYEKDTEGNIQFLTSGTLILANDAEIDAFLVGGGGGGGYDQGGGGGGGYTKTARRISLIAGEEYEIVIGDGGAPADSQKAGGTGEDTIAFGITASGGKGGKSYEAGNRVGGEGGSGGGGGGKTGAIGGDGGSNGENGKNGTGGIKGGAGQGYTTRAFEEEFGTLYAGGGAGCATGGAGTGGSGGGANGGENNGKENTGGGGGGGNIMSSGAKGGFGGSGIVIIRTAKAVGRQYLFDGGNEHEGFTNGWIGEPKLAASSSGVSKSANIVRENGMLVLDNLKSKGGVIRPSLGVDLTPYKTLVFEGEFQRDGTRARNITAAVWSTIGTYYATESEMLVYFQMENVETINRIELDVSNLEGLGYPGIGVADSLVKITACYLIPKD